MEEAVIRLKLAADAGADVCFVEGVKTEELLQARGGRVAHCTRPITVYALSWKRR